MKDELTVAEAADFLRMTNQGVRDSIRRGVLTAAGQPTRIPRTDVLALYRTRRTEATGRHPDPVKFAQEINELLWPEPVKEDDHRMWNADGTADAVFVNNVWNRQIKARDLRADAGKNWALTDAVLIFSQPVIETVARRDALRSAKACGWCFADSIAAVRDLPSSPDSEAMRVLLGKPCVRDRDRWAKQRDARAAVRAAGAPPSVLHTEDPRTALQREYSAAERALSAARARLNQWGITPHDHAVAAERYRVAAERFETARTALTGSQS